jgi:hypothetical protein
MANNKKYPAQLMAYTTVAFAQRVRAWAKKARLSVAEMIRFALADMMGEERGE